MMIVAGQGRVISNFAVTHFSATKHFSDKTRQIEIANAGQPFGNFWEEISIYCASSLMTAAASLEALINEIFITPGALQEHIKDFDTFFWGDKHNRGLQMKSALEKYREAVKCLDRQPLSNLDAQYKAAESLIAFRNHLIHFKPLWDEDHRNEELEKRLSGLFALSPFIDKGASFLEMQCMSAGCSAWAVQTVVDFVGYFRNRSGINSKKLDAFK
jgi:hypothetical protein